MKSKLNVFYFFTLVFLLSIILSLNNLLAQNVTITLKRPPPNQLKLADLWEITINNPSRSNLQVFLHGTVVESVDGLVVDANSKVFTLPPGLKIYRGSEVEPVKVNSVQDKYKIPFLRTGKVPDGIYRVCVEVILADRNTIIGTDCFDQVVKNISPPILITPTEGSEINEILPIFTWLAPRPITSGFSVTYKFKLVTLFRGQTPLDAMVSNPSILEQSNIFPTFFQFPISARQLVPNTNYAWKISAFNGRTLLGESEIWWFLYKPLKINGRDGVIKDRNSGDFSDIPIKRKDPFTGFKDNGRLRNPFNNPIVRTPNDKDFIPVGDLFETDIITLALIPTEIPNDISKDLLGELLRKCYK